MTLKIDPEYLNFAIPMRNIRSACRILKPHQDKFNCLSVVGVTRLHDTENVLVELDKLIKSISEYGSWKETALSKMGQKDSRDVMSTMFDVASNLNETPQLLNQYDPRKVLDLEKIDSDFVQKISFVWFTLHCTNNQTGNDMPLYVYQRAIVKLVWNVITTLHMACEVFNEESPITKFTMLGYEIHPGIDPACEATSDECVPKFTLHDHVVAFSQEEIEAENRRKAESAAEAERIQRLQAEKDSIKEHAELILKCYKRHTDAGNLEQFSFSEDGLKTLEDPSSHIDCERVESLYRFLTMMAESNRCMPGETMSDVDKIMGSFMELENDICSYHQRFLMSIFPGHLSHNDVIAAFSFFAKKLNAQYVDSKEFIEKPNNGDSRPKSIHVFI